MTGAERLGSRLTFPANQGLYEGTSTGEDRSDIAVSCNTHPEDVPYLRRDAFAPPQILRKSPFPQTGARPDTLVMPCKTPHAAHISEPSMVDRDPSAAWRASATYLYVLRLDAPSLAWEYLRRNPEYGRDWVRRRGTTGGAAAA